MLSPANISHANRSHAYLVPTYPVPTYSMLTCLVLTYPVHILCPHNSCPYILCQHISSTLPCPRHSTRIQADPGGSKWNGRNLVGIQVNSNLIPSKNNLIIQTQIFIYSMSFQVIPGGIQVKKRMIILATFQVHSHHIPGHSRSTPGSFQPHSGYIPAIFLVNSRSIYYSIY